MTFVKDSIQAAADGVDELGDRVEAARDRTATTIERIEDSRVPEAPVGGSVATVLAMALVLTLAATVWFDLAPTGVLSTFAALVLGDWVIKAGVVAAAGLAGWLAWTRSQLVTSARQTRAAAATTATGLTAAALAVVTGVVDPLALWATMLGDVVVTGATAGFAAITGLVGAASGKVMGAGRKGTAAAGTVGAVSGGLVGAATIPAIAGAGLIGLSLVTENPLWATVFGASLVMFVADRLEKFGPYTANFAFVIKGVTIAVVAAVAASVLFGIEIPLWEQFVGGGG